MENMEMLRTTNTSKEGWVRNWCFWTVVLEKIFESPLDCKISNQSILKEINLEYLLEGLMLKLKLQYFGHLIQRADSLEKTLILGKTEGRKRRGWQRMRWLDSITHSTDMLLLFSCSGRSNSLQPRGLQHARLPCPSPTSRDCSNSCPLSQGLF